MATEHRRSVLVTGASTGIGAATVAELVSRGLKVWATVRSDAAAAELTQKYGERVRVLQFDLTDGPAVLAAAEQVVADGPLDGLISNAGVALPGPLEFLPIAALREQLEVNLIGQLTVIQALLPALRASSAGRIVVVGSIGGRIAGPMLGAYSASKFGLVGLTDSLRAELAPWRIPVILIEPGAIATPIWSRGIANGEQAQQQMPPQAGELYAAQIERARKDAARSAKQGLSPDAVATVIAEALTAARPRSRYLVGRDAKVASVIARLPFRLRYRLTAAGA
jgi:NAD(P)-dependent dehydrogenase (short-subunit alcohol dehydrogenase family)